MLFFIGFALCIYIFCKFPFKLIVNNLKALVFVFIIAIFFNIFEFISKTTEPEDIFFKFFIFQITYSSVNFTCRLILRIFLLILISSLLTYTTLPLDLTLAIEEILRPLSKLKVPVSEISIMMSIALRFVPFLINEANTIIIAQKSRGLNLNNKRNILEKSKLIIIFLIPLLVSAFKKADELAVSMEARCFQVGCKRTRYRKLKFKISDLVFVIFGLAVVVLALILNNKFKFPIEM